MRRRILTDHDRAAWASYVQHVAPLDGVAVPPPPESEAAPEPAPTPPLLLPAKRRALAPLEVGTAPGGVDRATWARFRAGKLPAVRTLDLHGRTAQRAH